MATQKIAVAVIHGVGSQKAAFAKDFARRVRERFAREIGSEVPNADQQLQIRGAHWAPVLEELEKLLEARFHGMNLHWGEARDIAIDLGGDAIAYQENSVVGVGQPGAYDAIHLTVAGTLSNLALEAGPGAPLCIVGHSLGTIIASNYVWDLQSGTVPPAVKAKIGNTDLEQLKTLTLLYTMGSPIAVWSLRFPDFGAPITITAHAEEHPWRNASEWVNFYDRDDVIGYPLKCLNDAYDRAVTDDRQVNVGNLLTMWNPASHVGYLQDGDVVGPVADSLVKLWRTVNQKVG